MIKVIFLNREMAGTGIGKEIEEQTWNVLSCDGQFYVIGNEKHKHIEVPTRAIITELVSGAKQ